MSVVEILTVLATMFGGLALFLFGMNTMSDSLSSMTGGVLDKILALTIHGYETKDVMLSGTIQLYREEILGISDIVKKRHIRRSHGEEGSPGKASPSALYGQV